MIIIQCKNLRSTKSRFIILLKELSPFYIMLILFHKYIIKKNLLNIMRFIS